MWGGNEEMSDLILKCKRCGGSFIVSEKDKKFYALKGYNLPKYCPNCRKNKPQPMGSLIELIYHDTCMSYSTFERLKKMTYQRNFRPCVSVTIKKVLHVYHDTCMSYSTFEDLLFKCLKSTRINEYTASRIDDLLRTYHDDTCMSYSTFESMLYKLIW